jgi:hypothetical protein
MRNYGEEIGEGRRQINRKITQEATSALTWLVLVEDNRKINNNCRVLSIKIYDQLYPATKPFLKSHQENTQDPNSILHPASELSIGHE